MPHKLNRRSFLKGVLAAASAAAASGAPLPQAVKAAPSGRELATMLDLSKCIGCEQCVDACWEANEEFKPGEPVKPFPKMFPAKVPVEDWSDKQDVTDRLTPYNWLYVQHFDVEHNGEEHEIHAPRRCMHCQNPPCANLCPFGAASKQKNGITLIDQDLCMGGAKCRFVCPWHIPQRQTGVGLYLDLMPMFGGNGVMFKCNRCFDRVAQGQVPACIEACPEDVQIIGPRDEIVARAHERAKEINGFIYGEHENGGTNTIYVSPVPFEKLDGIIKKEKNEEMSQRLKEAGLAPGQNRGQGRSGQRGAGQGRHQKLRKKIARQVKQGRPHFGPAADSMAQAENLTAALVLAPVAGAALAVGRARKALKNRPQHPAPTPSNFNTGGKGHE